MPKRKIRPCLKCRQLREDWDFDMFTLGSANLGPLTSHLIEHEQAGVPHGQWIRPKLSDNGPVLLSQFFDYLPPIPKEKTD
jgi:hypothetical protein